ncbi:unnamed protein product [Prunus armeniaca]
MPPSFYMARMWQGGDVKYSSGFPIVFRLPIMSWTPGNRLVTPCWSRIPNYCKCKASLHSSSYRKLAFLYFLACERDLRELYYLLRRGIAVHTKISHTWIVTCYLVRLGPRLAMWFRPRLGLCWLASAMKVACLHLAMLRDGNIMVDLDG